MPNIVVYQILRLLYNTVEDGYLRYSKIYSTYFSHLPPILYDIFLLRHQIIYTEEWSLIRY